MERKRKKTPREEEGEDLLELEVVVDLVDVAEDVAEEAQGDVVELAKNLCNVYVQKTSRSLNFFWKTSVKLISESLTKRRNSIQFVRCYLFIF